MSISLVKDSWRPEFGKRYVFFKELEKTHPYGAAIVTGHYNTINNLFNQKIENTNNTEAGLSYMQSYLNFIQHLAQTERDNEIIFFKNYIDALEKNKVATSIPITEEIKKILNTPEEFDYIKFISLINILKNEVEKYEDDLKDITERIRSLKKISQQDLDTEIQRLMTYNERRRDKKNDQRLREEAIRNLRHANVSNVNHTIAEQLAIKIEQLLKKAFNDQNILNIIKKHITRTQSTTNLDVILENAVSIYVSENLKRNDSFSEWLDEHLEKFFTEISESTFYTLYDTKQAITIEEMVLRNENSISDKFLQFFSIKQQQIIIDRYDTNGKLKQAYNNLMEGLQNNGSFSSQDKARLTILLKKGIMQQFEEISGKVAFSSLKKQQQADIIKKMTSYLGSIAYTIKVTPFQMGELQAAIGANMSKIIEQGLLSKVTIPGQTINLKNDINIFYSFNSTNIKSTNFNILMDSLSNFMDDFMQEYRQVTQGATNIEAASMIYRKKMQYISDLYKKLLNELESKNLTKEIEEIKNIISNTFLGGISVKTYQLYENKRGFHGGSLGGGGRVVDAIPNILKMYELGGISTIDAELIIDALLNCSKSMIGGKIISLDNLKDYLIGGAAMVMFDDGFSTATNFLKQTESLFDGIAPRGLHLYQLQGRYIPASYILQNIYENFFKTKDDIENIIIDPMTSENVSSSLTITNNVSINKYRENKKYKDRPENWANYSNFAQEAVTIKFYFMAGILDIFDNISNAFNNI